METDLPSVPKGQIILTFFIFIIFILMGKEYILNKTQLQKIVESMNVETNEGSDGNYMAKQQLFAIATAAYKMWETMEDGEELEDWMSSGIAQAEQNVVSVFKAYMYDEFEHSNQNHM